ncbi:hypothetical protein KKC45_01060 [Patescibacteria group bacterium]|nr:hypothetical protein [Patescibacteria group bacterium]
MYYQEWRKQLNPEKKLRKYQHIDNPLDLNNERNFQKIVYTIENIKKHQFLPFIKKINSELRFRKNKLDQVERSLKNRPIMYASHLDSHIYNYYNFLIQDKYESYLNKLKIDDNVTAYRKIKIKKTLKGKCNVHFAEEVFDYISNQSECVVITQDITGFFDNINHSLLKEKVCKVTGVKELDNCLYKVFRSLTKYKYIKYSDLKNIREKVRDNRYSIYQTLRGFVTDNKTGRGIPQGSPISGLLANIYLVDFDYEIKTSFPNIFYSRYSDDLIFVCENDQKDDILNFVNKKIKQALLEINPKKSFLTYFSKNTGVIECQKVTDGTGKKINRDYVDYLGFEFNGSNTFLRKRTIQNLKHRQKEKRKRQLLNTQKQKRRKPRKVKEETNKKRGNYFKKVLEIMSSPGIKKQILKVVRDRNKIKKT